MIDKLLSLFGYIKLDNIVIQESFKKKPPRNSKMWEKRIHYMIYKEYEQPIVVNKINVLIDGYTTYLLMRERRCKYARVRRDKI